MLGLEVASFLGRFVPWTSRFSGITGGVQEGVPVARWGHGLNIGFRGTVLASRQLQSIQLVVVLLELSHLLDLVEVHDEAGIQVVQVLYALATED